MSTNQKLMVAGIGIALLIASTALAASYFTSTSQPATENYAQSKHPMNTSNQNSQKVASSAPSQPPCNDGNALGYVAGGAAGGVLGNQVGKGSGKTAATIAGTLGGAYLGGQYIPLKNVTCR